MTNGSEAFGERLRVERHQRHLTLKQLAAEAGVSLYRLRRIESGQDWPRLHEVVSLAAMFDVDPSVLADWCSDALGGKT